MSKIKSMLGLAGVAMTIFFATAAAPTMATAATSSPGLASSGITASSTVDGATDGGDTIDGLNVCKTYYTYNYNTPGCNALPIAPLCREKVKHVICTRY